MRKKRKKEIEVGQVLILEHQPAFTYFFLYQKRMQCPRTPDFGNDLKELHRREREIKEEMTYGMPHHCTVAETATHHFNRNPPPGVNPHGTAVKDI